MAISIILVLMSLVFGVAPKVTPGHADVLVAPVVSAAACDLTDSPVPLVAVLMVRALRLSVAVAATAVTGGAVAVGGMVGAVTVAGTGCAVIAADVVDAVTAVSMGGMTGAVPVVCAATGQSSALVAVVAGASTIVTGVTVVAAVFSSVSASVVSPILYGISVFLLNAEHRIW